MPRTEVRKECPSCGLGVPLDAKICEFCDWNFDEEDEWMSQIEKLEQELITEKRKFDDTSVDKMIQSTLRNPEEDKESHLALPPAPPAPVMKKKVIAGQPPRVKMKIIAPAGEGKAVTAPPVEKEPAQTSPPATVAAKPKSFRIDLANMQSPQGDLDLEPDLKGPKGGTETKGPPGTPAKQDKVVRRVISYGGQQKAKPAMAEQPKAAPARRATAPAPAAPKPAAGVAKPPASHKEPEAVHEKDEKKSRFAGIGKMFSVTMPTHGKKEDKPANHAPTKMQQSPPKAQPAHTIKVFVCPICSTEVEETMSKCPKCGAEFE